ncbi:hypothetical protein L3X38_043548 [Prunus dulcis]|uniref:Uncharacterized protein n=1 Tax=Prunus dulcis TaxID=3755 RepID=A0AAD4UZ13_PRUDU|nr:hypothetical protein L3X38_043548 [Prunus dulcis]
MSAESLPTNSNISSDLRYLNLSGCKSLKEIPELPPEVEPKLCDNLAHDLSMIENISLNKFSLCSVFLSSKQSQFDIVFPGSEVPKWFSHREDLYERSDESEFSLEIPRNFKLRNRGLSICVAVGINKILKETMQSKIGVEISQKEKEVVEEEEEEEKAQSNSGRCSFTARIYINGESVVVHSFFFEQTYVESPRVAGAFYIATFFVSEDEDLNDEDDENYEEMKVEDEENHEDLEDDYCSCEDDEDLKDE